MVTFRSIQSIFTKRRFFLNKIKIALSKKSKSYKNFILSRDFFMTVENSKLKDLINTFCTENPVREPNQLINCYKFSTPTSINLIHSLLTKNIY